MPKTTLSAAAVLLLTTIVSAQDTPPAPPTPPTPPAADATSAAEPAVVVTINGQEISRTALIARIDEILQQQFGARPLPEQLRGQLRDQVREQVLESMVENTLLDEQVKKDGITATDAELMADLNTRMTNHLIRTGSTTAEFEETLKQNDLTLDAFLKERSQDPIFKELFLQTRLLEKRFPKDLTVTDEEIKAKYDADLAEVYTRKEQVKASHILIGVDAGATDEQKAEAKTKISGILTDARKPDADFGSLAGEHSSCPSKAKGGDLGYFPREGAMVEPFAAAAFAMKEGEISEVVETQFGYHIIMVTDKKPAEVITFEQAKGPILQEIKTEKLAASRTKYVQELRSAATITYPS